VCWNNAHNACKLGVAVPYAWASPCRGREGVWIVFPLDELRDSEEAVVYSAPSFRVGMSEMRPVQAPTQTFFSRKDIETMRVPDCRDEIRAAATVLLSCLATKRERTTVKCSSCKCSHLITVTASATEAQSQSAYSFTAPERRNFIEAHRARGCKALTDWEKEHYIRSCHARGWWKGFLWFPHAPCFRCHKFDYNHQMCDGCNSTLRQCAEKDRTRCPCVWRKTQLLLDSALDSLQMHKELYSAAMRAYPENCQECVRSFLLAKFDGREHLSRQEVGRVVCALIGRKRNIHLKEMNCVLELAACALVLSTSVVCPVEKAVQRASTMARDTTQVSCNALACFIATDPCAFLKYFYSK